MGFLSFKFILFIAFAFAMYYLVPRRFQWLVLLFFSYLYYYLNSRLLVSVLFCVSVFTFLIGKWIAVYNQKIEESGNREDKKKLEKKKKTILTIGTVVVLSNLVIIKYSDFIITNFNTLIHGQIKLLHFVLPLGISFYTLQAISYLIDVSKGKCKEEENILRFLLYMSYFPQIIQGPIPRYGKLSKQLFEEHEYDFDRICKGLQLMLWGIAKKVIIADRLAIPVNYLFENHSEYHGLILLFAAICYSFQIYADFSGGIDAIKGISEVFGIQLDDNFRQPYFSRSIEEFWRRWHISLGTWMKDYVFYPLSLSKRFNRLNKKARSIFGDDVGKRFAPCIAMFIVYLLVGIWHGASWKYVIYGIWNGLFIASGILLENSYKKAKAFFRIKDGNRVWESFRMLRTFMICSIGRIFSRAVDLPNAVKMFFSIFIKPFDISYMNSELFAALGLNVKNWILLLIALMIVMYFDHLKEKGTKIREAISEKNIVLRWMIYYILIMSILVFGLYGGAYDASSFIYGRF